MRDIIDHVRFTPSTGKYKVFIIDEVHMLSKAAFNALLKTLEEPPAHALFILATTEIHKVPATIISRSQRFDFKRVSLSDILEVFAKVTADADLQISAEAQKLIAMAADGSFRDALSILDQIMSFSGGSVTAENVEEILGITRISALQSFVDLLASDQAAAVRFVQSLAVEGKDLVQFTKNFLEYLRLVLLVKTDPANLADMGLAAEEQEHLRIQADNLSSGRLLEIIKNILEAHRASKTSPVPELPLLVAVMNLSAAKQSVPAFVPKERVEALSTTININLGLVVDRWADVLARVKDYNHSLLSSLRLARILRLEGADLVLVFPYNFHKDTIEARKNRLVVEQVLEEVFGHKLRLKMFLEKDVKEGPAPDNDLLSEAVKILGKLE